ncbi:MAG: HAD family phosphatase [Akkermansiaceae bacterium]|nr:HAD family phosphatase [Akkermansiaceae bacterium]
MNFLFDIGRVLLDFDFEASLASLLPEGVGNPRERLERLLERKDELESGRIDADDYVSWALGVMGSEASPEEFRKAWCNIFTPNEPMWQQVRELEAAGHKLVLFSNINAIHVPWIYEAFPQFELFHGAVMSFEVGHIKPQPEIYAHALENHGLKADQTLYIDDLPENVEAGRAAGLRSWQYDLHKHAEFEQWLESQLQETPSHSS